MEVPVSYRCIRWCYVIQQCCCTCTDCVLSRETVRWSWTVSSRRSWHILGHSPGIRRTHWGKWRKTYQSVYPLTWLWFEPSTSPALSCSLNYTRALWADSTLSLKATTFDDTDKEWHTLSRSCDNCPVSTCDRHLSWTSIYPEQENLWPVAVTTIMHALAFS